MAFRQIKSPALADQAVIAPKLSNNAVEGQTEISSLLNPEQCFILFYDAGNDTLCKISGEDFVGSFSTDDINEGDNLFFTPARAQDAVAQDIADAVSVESSRATAAEALLQTAVDNEAIARASADTANAQAISDEVIRATARENTIEEGYKAADGALSLRIDNIMSNTDEVALNSLAEIVEAFQGADDALSASVIANSGAISAEVTRATGAEGVLRVDLASEVSARQSGDATNAQAIVDEAALRVSGDQALDTRLSTAEGEIDALQSDLAAEISSTDVEIAALQSGLEAEVTRATGAESANATSIEQEIVARAGADASIRVDLTAAIASGDAATLASAKAHDALLVGDASVDGSTGNTVSDRIASAKAEAIADADASVAAEQSAREIADTGLQAEIDAEEVRAVAEEARIEAKVDAEVVRATGEEARIEAKLDNVISNTDADALDSLTEIVTEFQKVDGEISALVSSNTVAISTEAGARASGDSVLQGNIDSEAATRAAADASLQGQIDNIELDYVARDAVVKADAAADATQKADQAEADAIAHADAQDTKLIGDASVDGTAGNTVSARILSAQQAANTYTDGQVSAEATTRKNADDALSLRATNLEGRMDTAETDIDSLETGLSTETGLRVAGDTQLQTNIDSEATARGAADDVLQDNIDAEVLRATTAEGVNATAISNEVTRATGVEAGLRLDVDANTSGVATNAGAISAEITRAKAAEAANAQAIVDEAGSRSIGDGVLQTALDLEIQARIDGDAALRSDIDINTGDISDLDSDLSAEVLRATAAELVLSQNLASEVVRATGVEGGLRTDVDLVTGRVDAIIGTSPETLDTLQEIVAAFEDADSDIQGVIAANSGRLSVNESDIDAVELRATDLETRASSLEVRANSLEIEQSAQGGRLNVNEGDIDSLETKVGSATLETVASDLSGAVNELHTQVDLEAGKVSTLEGEMDAVEGRLDTVEPKVATLESEMDDAEGRLTVNEADIDSLESKVGTGVFDTTAQTIVGAVNEVHGELNAVEARVTGHDSDVSSLQAQVTAEVLRATNEEGLIRSEFAAADTALETAYIAADVVVKSEAALDASSKANTAEANAKVYADDQVAAEAVLREGADNVLQSAITAEESARIIGDGALSNRITVVETEMTATQTGAGLATDGTYSAPSGSNYLDASTSLKDADAKLDAAVKAEVVRATGVEGGLQNQINVEEAARIAGDSNLSDSLSSEVARAVAAEGVLTSGVNTNAQSIVDEAAARVAADEALQGQIDFIKENTDSAALDSLTEIVAAFQNADSTLTGAVAANELAHEANAEAISDETAARAAGDAALQTAIDTLEDETDTALAGKVSKSGDSMTGSLAMGGNKVTGLANGVDAADAVNKGQLQSAIDSLTLDNYSTDDLVEGSSNLYFTTERAEDAISVVDVSGEGKVSKTDGVISIDTAKSLLELTDVVDSAITDKEGFVLRAKTDGTGFELVSPDLLSFSRSKRQVFAGDGSQTIFAIDFDVTEQNAMVFVGGVIQDPSVHYFIDTAAKTITFNGAMPVGTQAVLVAQSSTSVGVLDPGSVTLETLAPNVKVFQQGGDVIVGTSESVVSSFPASVYRSAKYVVSVELNGEFETRECLVVHNGTAAFITEYGIIYTGDDLLGDTNVRLVNGTVELTYEAVSAGAVVTASVAYTDV